MVFNVTVISDSEVLFRFLRGGKGGSRPSGTVCKEGGVGIAASEERNEVAKSRCVDMVMFAKGMILITITILITCDPWRCNSTVQKKWRKKREQELRSEHDDLEQGSRAILEKF